MQFISVRDFRTKSAAIWKNLPEERNMVITNNGKPIALLTPVDEKNLESTLSDFIRVRAIQAMREMQEISARNGNDKMTLEEINEIIADTRKRMKNADCS